MTHTLRIQSEHITEACIDYCNACHVLSRLNTYLELATPDCDGHVSPLVMRQRLSRVDATGSAGGEGGHHQAGGTVIMRCIHATIDQ